MSLENLLNRYDTLYRFWFNSYFKKAHDNSAHRRNIREYNKIRDRMNEIETVLVSVPFCNINFPMKLSNKGHNVIFYDVIKNGGVYEPETTKFICETLHDNFNCIDIGANNGYYTILMSMLCGQNSVVYSYEPMPDSYKLLLDNVKEQNNVRTFNVALGSANGYTELNFESEADGTASGIKLPSHRNQIKVPVTTLDHELMDNISDFLSKPTLIKIDVEGFEPDVMRGGGVNSFLTV